MTREQQGLLEKAARSLNAARRLKETGFAEFSASRSYYTMFYVAEAFLEGEGVSFSRHSAVIAAFGQRFARPRRIPVEFHRYLISAEQTRLRGDYNIEPNVTELEAAELIDRAEEMLEFAKANIDSIP